MSERTARSAEPVLPITVCTVADHRYRRYVAVGDSQTEGLWDVDDSGALIGFADRLARMIDALSPGSGYANLAVRGKRVRDVLDVQLPQALSMRPDLITVCVGMNDVTRPGRKFRQALEDLDELHRGLASSGATVVTTTFPDLASILPVGRSPGVAGSAGQRGDPRRGRRHGFRLVDLYHADVDDRSGGVEPRPGARVPARGRLLFTAAAARGPGVLPGSSRDWALAGAGVADAAGASVADVLTGAAWTQNLFMPWVWRHLRGRGAEHGRVPQPPRASSGVGGG